ncbi:MAG TPA: hypothetical protein VF649_07325 [Sphingomonas sp.]|uniref:hypothetical protein n=1 Tax=Sphingomonas sp. TaxID=28214 RepID=UPI002ED86645
MARKPAAPARAADAIVVAEVMGVDDRDTGVRSYRLRVSGSWKARLSGIIAVRSETTTCRAELTDRQRYLVYLKRVGRTYWTDGCAGNLPLLRAKPAIAVLGRPFAGS